MVWFCKTRPIFLTHGDLDDSGGKAVDDLECSLINVFGLVFKIYLHVEMDPFQEMGYVV